MPTVVFPADPHDLPVPPEPHDRSHHDDARLRVRRRPPARRRRAAPKAGEPLKIGFVYVSPIGDAGWTFQHDTGRKQIEKTLGDKIKTSFIESVPEGADAERVIRELAAPVTT